MASLIQRIAKEIAVTTKIPNTQTPTHPPKQYTQMITLMAIVVVLADIFIVQKQVKKIEMKDLKPLI